MPKAKSSIFLSNFIEPQSVSFAIRKSFAACREKLRLLRRNTSHKRLLEPQQFICCMQSANCDLSNHVTNVFTGARHLDGSHSVRVRSACFTRHPIVQARIWCRTEVKNKMRPQQGWSLPGGAGASRASEILRERSVDGVRRLRL